ncbi:MAG TPA: pyrroloquinoline quinone biosynthesis peptide chaperone PqqD [Polyangiaceae bacterium]|nr:pyrroloquinoline quinone biosynthesis peptide chaperone PqqD [Polyangiaceae bacterium]
MIPRAAHPRLASKAKLRHDRRSGQDVLLYPEKGLVLNATGSAILKLCTGEHSFDQICEQLAQQFQSASKPELEAHVTSFLETLAHRGLIEGIADAPIDSKPAPPTERQP